MIFLDSSFIIALTFDKDENHEKSLKLMNTMRYERKMINSTVLIEVLNTLKKNKKTSDIRIILDYLINLDEIHYLTYTNYKDSIETFKFYNFSINYADCTILNTMVNKGVNKIASFDSDFDKVKGIYRIICKLKKRVLEGLKLF